jgi:hypothetical protein
LVLLFSLTALVLSYLVNKWMLKLFKEYAVIFGAPVMEELLKTLPAYYWNRSVFHVHFLFGLGEALYDYAAASSKDSGRRAAVFSMISHSFFGAVTVLILGQTGLILPAMVGAVTVHCVWNAVIMRWGKREGKGS